MSEVTLKIENTAYTVSQLSSWRTRRTNLSLDRDAPCARKSKNCISKPPETVPHFLPSFLPSFLPHTLSFVNFSLLLSLSSHADVGLQKSAIQKNPSLLCPHWPPPNKEGRKERCQTASPSSFFWGGGWGGGNGNQWSHISACASFVFVSLCSHHNQRRKRNHLLAAPSSDEWRAYSTFPCLPHHQHPPPSSVCGCMIVIGRKRERESEKWTQSGEERGGGVGDLQGKEKKWGKKGPRMNDFLTHKKIPFFFFPFSLIFGQKSWEKVRRGGGGGARAPPPPPLLGAFATG